MRASLRSATPAPGCSGHRGALVVSPRRSSAQPGSFPVPAASPAAAYPRSPPKTQLVRPGESPPAPLRDSGGAIPNPPVTAGPSVLGASGYGVRATRIARSCPCPRLSSSQAGSPQPVSRDCPYQTGIVPSWALQPPVWHIGALVEPQAPLLLCHDRHGGPWWACAGLPGLGWGFLRLGPQRACFAREGSAPGSRRACREGGQAASSPGVRSSTNCPREVCLFCETGRLLVLHPLPSEADRQFVQSRCGFDPSAPLLPDLT